MPVHHFCERRHRRLRDDLQLLYTAGTVMTACDGYSRIVKTECELSGPGWRQTIYTPSVVEVNRSADRIRIDCNSPEIGRGTAELEASSNFKWVGNINPFNLVGTAVIGDIVDSA
ncbi:MAG: hypothetical protein ACO21T_14990 [Alphaproteobacteria bacterium]